MTDLKLIALESEDLKVVSAQLQDAVLKIADIGYFPSEKRFAALLNRFDWTEVQVAENAHKSSQPYTRRRTALRFENVNAARLKGIDLSKKEHVLNLLAIQFEANAEDDPSGYVSLIFAGDAAIRLDVEYIEAEMRDLGGVWATSSKPEHTTDEDD
jgi:Protein of unknown function (DUF2948)